METFLYISPTTSCANVLSIYSITPFTINNNTFMSLYQFILYRCALIIENKFIAEIILQNSNPNDNVRLINHLKSNNLSISKDNLINICKIGSYQKFLQNPYAGNYLCRINSKVIFIFADPNDRFWGIGYDKNTCNANTDKWGDNRLNDILICTKIAIQSEFYPKKNCETPHTSIFYSRLSHVHSLRQSRRSTSGIRKYNTVLHRAAAYSTKK